MDHQALLEANESLKKTSLILFGESAELRLVDPQSLSLLKENARYFKKEMFKQLVQNVKADKKLSSVPLCHVAEGGKLEVLSGNHRVQASVEARLEVIMVMVILEDLSKSRQIAIQLSHNALVGVDDPQILANLWAKIDDIKAKCYAGLNSKDLGDLKDIKLISFSTPTIRTRHLVFAFSDVEAEAVESVLKELAAIPAKPIYLAPLSQFDAFFTLLQQTKEQKGIKNGALAFLNLVELASQALDTEAKPEKEAC